ncbi:Na+/H+ antiporter subunit D, partial [Staphylococcus capitis]
ISTKVNSYGLITVSVIAVAITVLFGLSADVLYPIIKDGAETFYDPSVYINSVLGGK